MMRLAALGFAHESNTFSSRPTTLASIEAAGLLRGEEILRVHRGARSTMAGFIEASTTVPFELVPLVFTYPTPSGVIEAGAFETIVNEMVSAVRRVRCDGVLLAQHGAAVSERHRDADAEILRRVREALPTACKVGVVLDMHANISHEMVEAVDVTVVYRTNPHLDARDRGIECARLVAQAVRGEIQPVQHLVQIPAVINIIRQSTSADPMRTIMAAVDAVLPQGGVLSASVAEGYPYADVSEMGMAAVVVADGDARIAEHTARDLARSVWARRAEFTADLINPRVAVETAMRAGDGPILLLDAGDNIGGGGPGDATHLLHEARVQGLAPTLSILFDPEVAAECTRAGVGGVIDSLVGGKTDQRHGMPLELRGTIRAVTDGKYTDFGPTHAGHSHYDTGPTVAVDDERGNTVIVTSQLVMPVSLNQVLTLGIEPRRYRAIVAKGVVSPLPAYEPVTRGSIVVSTPGCTTPDLGGLEFEYRRSPLFPFETNATLEHEHTGTDT